MATTEFLHGMRERVSVVEETSYGSGGDMAANGAIIGYNAAITAGFDQGFQEITTNGADDRAVEDYSSGPAQYPFTLTFAVTSWKWLKYMFACADAGSDPYTHTLTLANTVESFKCEWAKRATTSHVLTLTGCVIKKARIRFSKATGEGKEGLITVEAECVAKTSTPGTTVTTLDAGNLSATPFKFFNTKFTLAGSEVVEVNNGEINIDNGIKEEDSRYCNSTAARNISDPIPSKFLIDATFNVNVKNDTYYDLWATADEITSTNTLEFERATNDDLVMTFAKLFIFKGVASTNLEGVTNVDLVTKITKFTSLIATDAISSY